MVHGQVPLFDEYVTPSLAWARFYDMIAPYVNYGTMTTRLAPHPATVAYTTIHILFKHSVLTYSKFLVK